MNILKAIIIKMIETIYNLVWEFDIKNKKDNEIKNENQCSKCNKILSSKRYLEKHLLICKGVLNPLECHYCHKILCDSSSKSKHLKICKDKLIENKDKHQCSKCNKILSSQQYLQKHLLICNGVLNPLECHLCHNIFANSGSKSTHLKMCKFKLSLIDNEKQLIPINYITNIIVFNQYNINDNSFKTDHINLEFISNLLNIKEEDALTLYTEKILDNPENRCIKKTNLRSTFSEIHVGNNKWNSYYDSDIYPKFISEINNCLYELLIN